MRIVLSGSTGFVGTHLKKYLTDLGYDIVCISKEEFQNQDFKVFTIETDVVVHCAWVRERDLHSIEHLEFAVRTCVFFDFCRDMGIRVINLGSSSEYGIKDKPMKETDSCNPITTYGIAKLMVTLYAQKLGFNTLRLFAVTGNGGHSFMDNLSSDKWSDQKQVRHYVAVDLVCLAVQRMIHARHLYGEIINVASHGSQKTNYEVAELLAEPEVKNKYDFITDKRWNKYPQRQYEHSMWQADTTKMVRLLNI